MSASKTNAQAIAFCVSPDYSSAIRIAHRVAERVVIDETFATRDLVADLSRTTPYRVVTISDHKVRLFVGDTDRLVEERDATWPLERADESTSVWYKSITDRLSREDTAWPLPTIVAGVNRTVRRAGVLDKLDPIGRVAGSHDRTGWGELHRTTLPVVERWLQTERDRAVDALQVARSAKRYAAGLDELWALAHQGRIATLVVEEHFAPAARLVDGRLELADDREHPEVIDDVVDELIEGVLLRDGTAVIVPDGRLDGHDRIAAVLRY